MTYYLASKAGMTLLPQMALLPQWIYMVMELS